MERGWNTRWRWPIDQIEDPKALEREIERAIASIVGGTVSKSEQCDAVGCGRLQPKPQPFCGRPQNPDGAGAV